MRVYSSLVERLAAVLVCLGLGLLYPAVPGFAQGAPKPTQTKPSTSKPSTSKPSTSKPATAKPAPPKAVPEPPPPSDLRFKTRYTNGDQVTESVSYIRGDRERYELSDMILLRQHDQKRTIQISRSANTYLITPDPVSSAAAGSGVVILDTSIADVGERKTMFGQPARRIVTVIDRQPEAGACDQSKQRIETDGWYIDLPKTVAAQLQGGLPELRAPACRDDVKAKHTGDTALLGFPISYSTTIPGNDGKPVSTSMEITEFEITRLDAALFEIPEGITPVTDARQLSKAVSDANEAKLASGTSTAGPAADKKAGTIRVGVPEFANKATQQVDTRALRTQMIAELTEQKLEAVPLAAAPEEELNQRAKELGCDYLLIAQVAELKASKPGGIRRMVKATAGEAQKDITEAKVSVRLMPVAGAKPRLSTTTSGNDGGIGFKTGLRLARVAAMMYLKYASPLTAMNAMQMMNMGGMGFLNNPMLMQMQGGGMMGAGGTGGVDRTAGAAMFLLDTAMAASADGSEEGPSFDASLSEALQDAAKRVGENLKR
jgi:hypothetical protein